MTPQDFTNNLLYRMGKRTMNPESCSSLDKMTDLANEILAIAGKPRVGGFGCINAALISSDFPQTLAGTVNKIAVDMYPQVPASFEAITDRGTLPNFKEASHVRVGHAGILKEIPPAGQYETVAGFDEGSETAALKTYGGTVPISRQAIVNDDLNAISDAGSFLARSSKATQNTLVYKYILSNPSMSDGTAVFDADRGNLLTGAGSALSLTSLGSAMKTLRLMAGSDGCPYGIEPKILLVPPSLEATATSLCKSIETANKERLTLIVEPLLEASYLTGGSATAWYLLPDPTISPVFRTLSTEGDTPFVASFAGTTSDNINFKIRIDFDVLALNGRAIKAAGE